MKRDLTSGPRVLLVGDYIWPWYQDACANALEHLGCVVERFGWFEDFRQWREDHSEPFYQSLWHRIQYRLLFGPTVFRVGRRLLWEAKQFQPDIVWFYNVQLIAPGIIRKMRKSLPSATFVQYANDNPFSPLAKPGLWRHYLNSIEYFDIHCVFRHSNIDDYRKLGAKKIMLLRSYFIPEDDYPEPQSEIPERFKCDVVFAGHYEDDGRVEMLESICDNGYSLNLFGGGWDAALSKLKVDSPLRSKYPIIPEPGKNYRYAICGAKVALCFLSSLNNDTYTTRSFQIPAMKTAMLSQFTEDLTTLFRPDEEALFFRDRDEMMEKLKRLVENTELRSAVAEAGYARVYGDGHDVSKRMECWLSEVKKWGPNKTLP